LSHVSGALGWYGDSTVRCRERIVRTRMRHHTIDLGPAVEEDEANLVSGDDPVGEGHTDHPPTGWHGLVLVAHVRGQDRLTRQDALAGHDTKWSAFE
jgi:hypothetical protein